MVLAIVITDGIFFFFAVKRRFKMESANRKKWYKDIPDLWYGEELQKQQMQEETPDLVRWER